MPAVEGSHRVEAAADGHRGEHGAHQAVDVAERRRAEETVVLADPEDLGQGRQLGEQRGVGADHPLGASRRTRGVLLQQGRRALRRHPRSAPPAGSHQADPPVGRQLDQGRFHAQRALRARGGDHVPDRGQVLGVGDDRGRLQIGQVVGQLAGAVERVERGDHGPDPGGAEPRGDEGRRVGQAERHALPGIRHPGLQHPRDPLRPPQQLAVGQLAGRRVVDRRPRPPAPPAGVDQVGEQRGVTHAATARR